MAARSVITDDRQAAAGVNVETVIIPGLGLPVQLREWYDANNGKQYLNMNVLYGMSVGKPTNGIRITTSA